MELNYVSVSLLLSIITFKNVFTVIMVTHVGMLVEFLWTVYCKLWVLWRTSYRLSEDRMFPLIRTK